MVELHPVELESVYANEDLKSKEERKVILNGVVLTEKEIDSEEKQRIAMYDLYLGAQSLRLAQQLEHERNDYFESLYDFSYGVVNLSDEPVFMGSTESKALYIIDEKKSYDLKIIKLKERYSRFRGLLSGLDKHDVHLLRNYFEHGHKVDYETLRMTINRISKYLNEQEVARGKALDAEAAEEYAEELKTRRIKEGRAIAKQNEGKQQYLIDGVFVYMSQEEYEKYMKVKKEEDHERSEWLLSVYRDWKSNNSNVD